MDYAERMRSVYTEEELHEIDRAVHVKIGHSNLSAHFAAPRYTTDYLESRKLIDLIEEQMEWFEISRLDTSWRSKRDPDEGQDWEVTLINFRDLSVRGPTLEIAIAKAILLGGVSEFAR